MVGGAPGAFERARPAFEAMGKTVVHMGGPGAGTATKLANQLLVGVHSVASCEALLLAARAGVDPEKLLHVLSRSWGQSRILERNAPAIRRREFGPSASPLRNLLKDLTIIIDLAREQGLDLPTAAAARRVYEDLVARGRGEWDITAPYAALEEGGGGPATSPSR
jgi:3-hydroxyisobutyrate dehydrogenase-like beta-hydroxyacid dehydrogenase